MRMALREGTGEPGDRGGDLCVMEEAGDLAGERWYLRTDRAGGLGDLPGGVGELE